MYHIKSQISPVSVKTLMDASNNFFMVFGGPCSVESKSQISNLSSQIDTENVHVFRGGTYKARTKPDAFQGLGAEGISLLYQLKLETGKPIVTEILSIKQLYDHLDEIDIIQIGTRNMYNYELLKEVGNTKKPVILKRGFSATIDEFLGAASYISSNGNENIILCERGIRTFETSTRNTLDLSSIPIIKQRSPYQIIVDPSHGTGRRDLIAPMSKAAMACGADGVMIEVHPDPDHALSDGFQSINPEMFNQLINELKALAPFFGKRI